MNRRSEKLDTALEANRRRLNESKLRLKLRAVAVHARPNKIGDVESLESFSATGPDESIYFSGWSEVAPIVLKALDRFADEIILAPYNFREAGTARVHKAALAGQFMDDPLEFDRDGFWISDESSAILIDFDDDHLKADVRWARYGRRKD